MPQNERGAEKPDPCEGTGMLISEPYTVTREMKLIIRENIRRMNARHRRRW